MGQILHKKGKTAVKHSILWKKKKYRLSLNTECLGSGEIPTLISQGKEVKKRSSDIGIKPKKFKMLKVKGRQCFKKEWMNEQGTPSNTKWSSLRRPENDHRIYEFSEYCWPEWKQFVEWVDRTLIREGSSEKWSYELELQ